MSSILPSMRSSRSLQLGSSTNALILCVGYPLPHVIKCWCGTIAASFSQVAQRQSRPFLFFPPGCTFLVATSVACFPCHLVRVTSTFVVGKVAKFVRRQKLQLLYVVQLRTVVFSRKRMVSFSLCLDTASFRSCLSLPPGFLDTREAGICAGSRECFSLLLLLDFSVLAHCCKVIQASIEQILVKRRRNVKDWQLR